MAGIIKQNSMYEKYLNMCWFEKRIQFLHLSKKDTFVEGGT